MVETPELDKMKLAKAEGSQSIGEFLEWIGGKGLAICELADTDQLHDQWIPARRSTEQLLADFFEIDLAAVERERRAVLEEFQANSKGP